MLRPSGTAGRFFEVYARTDEATIRRARGLAAMQSLFLMLMGQNRDRGPPVGKPHWRSAGRAALERVLQGVLDLGPAARVWGLVPPTAAPPSAPGAAAHRCAGAFRGPEDRNSAISESCTAAAACSSLFRAATPAALIMSEYSEAGKRHFEVRGQLSAP
ncbi:hypothetical protein GCM10023318_19270 [Nocardia callitridis]|uniref:Uncharacterized protein n=1 Tax=Nocardia callitridis TaxID=648753 RepID=A0ABP9K5G3_9NOCA